MSITYGEQLIKRLMQQLPEDDFYCYAEPRIDSTTKTSRYADFVIVWRKKGLLCVEVKDWKEILGGDQRQIKITIQSEIITKSNPFQTARDYTHQLLDRLNQRRELKRSYHGQELLAFPIEPLTILTLQSKTTLSWLQKEGIFPENNVLCSDDLVSISSFRQALERVNWTFKLNTPLSNTQLEVIKHTLGILEVRTKPSDSDKGIKRGSLLKEQDEIVWAPLPVRESGIATLLVRGVVGSGKTIVISKKSELVAELRPDLEILVTAFNIDLAKDLKERIRNPRVHVKQIFDDIIEVILGDKYPRITKYRDKFGPRAIKDWLKENNDLFGLPIDFVAMEIARRKDLSINSELQYRNDLRKRDADLSDIEIDELCAAYDLYREFQDAESKLGKPAQDFEDAVSMALREIHHHPFHRKYHFVMVDEGQDFSPNIFNLLRGMMKPGGFLMVCDDPMQSLWRQFDLVDKGLKNASVQLLKLPLRTTREIAELAQSLFELMPSMRTDDDHEIYPAPTHHLESGNKPFLNCYANRQEEQQKIIESIDNYPQNTPNQPIAVITPEYADKSFVKELRERNIYYGHFNLMKGLEFHRVYIAHLDDIFSSKWNERSIMRRWLYRKLFVAITRARNDLHISYTGAIPNQLSPIEYYCQIR